MSISRASRKSDVSGFHKLTVKKRLAILKKFASLDKKEIALLKSCGALNIKTADMMIENVVGTTHFPFGIATNFLINGCDYLVPMAIEEPSVVAAASYAAKLARPGGGFTTTSDPPLMIGQIQIVGLSKWKCLYSKRKILRHKKTVLELANRQDSIMVKLGGGVKNVEARAIKTTRGWMLIVHLIVDVRDAMGANAINNMAEGVAPYLEHITGGKVRLRIISNLAVRRLARASAVWKKDVIGEDVVDGVLDAYAFAQADQYRCTTHNKGVMNGIDAVAIATGNDFRAIEAGAHSYASLGGYHSLTHYEKDSASNLVGRIELPIAVGVIGGATKTHPIAKISLKILDTKSAQELAEIMAAVGLAQNFAALRAMANEGIQHGHMELHAKNIAVMAGARGKLIHSIAEKIVAEKNINVNRAKELLKIIRERRKKK